MSAFDLRHIGQGLAFARSLPELAAVLSTPGAAAVVQAPPGTGKTTLVPPLAANVLGATPKNRILISAPRRVAVRSAARRLAALDGSELGGRVGYSLRGDRQGSAGTVIEFLTPGILLRRLLGDPGLEGVAAVVVDEVHERALDSDLLLGMLNEVRELRDDLSLIAMSATLDAPRFGRLLGMHDGGSPAPVVDCPSALYPLSVLWEPPAVPRIGRHGVTGEFLTHVAATAANAQRRAVTADPGCDVLVFAPGAREIATIASHLRQNANGVEVLELHGQVSARDQDRAVSGRRPGDLPRIIVSSSLAESSLTVPGVKVVVDAGLAREPRRDAARGMSGLVTVTASRASAEQRAGRAARQGPGTVVRCYAEKDFAAAPAHPTPEIAVADLSSAALTLACWGAPEGKNLRLPDPPPASAMAEAVAVLQELGAVEPDGKATELGRKLSGIPAEPRLARALLDGARLVGSETAAEIVALVAGDTRAAGADLGRALGGLRSGKDPASRRWRAEVQRFARVARHTQRGDESPAPAEQPGFIVGLAYPDRVARLVKDASGQQYLLSSGTRAGLPAGSSLAGHEWLAIADLGRAQGKDTAGTGALIRLAAPLSLEGARRVAATLLSETVTATLRNGRITARREQSLGAIPLSATPVAATPEQARAALAEALRRDGLALLPWSEAAVSLRARMAFLHREMGPPWPDVSDAALLAQPWLWLGAELSAVAGGAPLSGVNVAGALRGLLPWPEAALFDELAPPTLEVPSGSSIRIGYPDIDDAGPAVVAVKLQECFGLAQTPLLAAGRSKVLFHLLSPARRPLAVTDDLRSFWSGPYAQVRAEMRGRYPKHPWPEDPWSAPATARVKNRI